MVPVAGLAPSMRGLFGAVMGAIVVGTAAKAVASLATAGDQKGPAARRKGPGMGM